MNEMRVLFIGKEGDSYSKTAADFVRLHFKESIIVFSKRTDPFPVYLNEWDGDIILSYLAQWIIPDSLLQKAKKAAINFHPGPPDYPGIGCTNFAVYNKEKEFGITCHHMLAKVDSGSIIEVRRFPVFEGDTVYSITQRCYTEILHLFYKLISDLLTGKPLPHGSETWTRKPYTRKQLNELCELKPDMDKEEIDLRIKATTYGTRVWAHMKTEEINTTYSSHKK
jgi:methionyl-tRNA formyltransferase